MNKRMELIEKASARRIRAGASILKPVPAISSVQHTNPGTSVVDSHFSKPFMAFINIVAEIGFPSYDNLRSNHDVSCNLL